MKQKYMKKLLLLFLTLLLTGAVCGCEKEKESEEKKDNVVNNQEEVQYEKPYEGNAAILPYGDKPYTSSYDDEAETLRQEILELEDTKFETDVVYYISYKGDDFNDGLTPETAWKTTTMLNVTPPNSTVLFERGGVYRGNFKLASNVNYGAYGEGAKPCIYGSAKNYADDSLWRKHSDNVWKVRVENAIDVGNVVLNHGEYVAARVFNKNSLNRDYTYIYQDEVVYMYCSQGNPGQAFSDIEISDTVHVITGPTGLENVTIENLCIKYGAAHGIGFERNTKNITIRGCEIGYIGGGIPGGGAGSRYGNGIEFWMECENIVVEDCWVYQCYDAGITHQSGAYAVEKNINFDSNLVEYCQYNLEFFNQEGQTINVTYSNNILRFAGYGVFDPKDRRGSNSSATANICLWWRLNPCENFVIKDNILDTSYGYLIAGWHLNEAGKGPTVFGNAYVQQPQMATYYMDVDSTKIVPAITKTADDKLYAAGSQSAMDIGVAAIDKSPKKVLFEKYE